MLLLVAGLAACGGGTSAPPPPSPMPAFALTSAVPAEAASGVARDGVITATFSAALDGTTVSAGNITLTGPGNNTIPVALAVTGGGTVEIRPKAGALPGDTSYTLALSTAIKDSNGRALPQAVNRTFNTAGVNWAATAGALATLSDFNSASIPAIYTDGSGSTTVAWLSPQGLTSNIYTARLDAINSAWSKPVLVATYTGALIGGLGLAPGPAGDLFLTWSRVGFSNGIGKDQVSRYSAASATWSTPVEVRTAPSPGFPVPVSDALGNLTLLNSNGTSVFATRLNAGASTWSEPRAIEYPHPNNYVFPVRAVTDATGNIVAAWMQVDDRGRAIYAARYDAALSEWATAQRVASTPMNGNEPIAMGVDATGVVTLAWTRSAGVAGGDTVWASRLNAQGQAWSPPVRMDRTDPAAPDARNVMLVVDSAGTATALWRQGNLRSARWSPGAAEWSAPDVVAPGGVPLESAGLMLGDTAGNIVVVGQLLDQKLMATRYFATTGQWRSPVLISAPPTGTSYFTYVPVASVDGAGNVVVMWVAFNQMETTDQFVLSFNRLR